MEILEKVELKSKIEFILEYLDHKKVLFSDEIYIYPKNEDTIKIKNYIENIFQTKIKMIDKINKFPKNKFLVFNSDLSSELEYLLDKNYNFKNILITSNILVRGYRALIKLLDNEQLKTVLDIGCGDGIQGKIFIDNKKTVTGINLGLDELYKGKYLKNYGKIIIGDYLNLKINQKYDIIWLSHILEHIRDIELFLLKVKNNINIGGALAIIVPPNETDITLNHIHTFNTGRLLRYLVVCGYDCRNACCFDYGYNKCVIIPKVEFHNFSKDYLKTEKEVKKSFKYLPECIKVNKISDGNLIFDGNIQKINC